MIPWQVQLLLSGLLALGVGATVGFILRRRVMLSLIVTTVFVLFIHLANDYCRSGFPPITLHGVAISIYFALVPLVWIAWLPALVGAVLVIVICRLISTRGRGRPKEIA